MATKQEMRTEKDSMGEMQVPVGAYYAAQTQRAVENFPISALRFPRSMIAALGLIKGCAAKVNAGLGLVDGERADLIQKAAAEVESGALDAHFVVDIFQTGSGTSSNMNANEVIANRAKELSSGNVAVHPNDHVNNSQSSNDVIPTAIHIALAKELTADLIPALGMLEKALAQKAEEFSDIVKTGRTHLQDATPITLGQEFSGYARQVQLGIERVKRSLPSIYELPLGGTAVGTGLNTHPDFARKVIAELSERTGLPFAEAANHFEAQAAKDGLVEMSGQLKTIACSLAKIANDIRWLGSGPRCGIGELQLPEVQPGSSIMPGKVNPVIAESLLMVCAQVVGNDAAVNMGGYLGSTFELNVAMPVMAYNILQASELLAAGARNFAAKCVSGIEPNRERLAELAEASIANCTALAPIIGYDKAAQLAKTAFKTGKPLRQVAIEEQVLPEDELAKVLDLLRMTKPGLV
ncbi:MAG: class II fumarate hydratase [Bdellovibrionales bacterium]|nr:class II fumarate hydratase [Bdellovibrionales bacterium]